jgi:hypothetical protein
MSITVYGASDDVIEIDGDIAEEFYYTDNSKRGDFLAFSDGTILRIVFGNDGWRITPVFEGTSKLTIVQHADGEDGTDRAALDGDVAWVVHGIGWVKRP